MHPTRKPGASGCGAVLLVAAALGLPLAVPAQDAPLVTPRDLRPEPLRTPPPVLPQAAPPQAPPGAAELVVTIGAVTVEGAFPELADATQQRANAGIGRKSVAQLYQVAESVEALYRQAGFPLVRVTVPPQSLNDGGTFRLVLVDGFIEHVDVSALAARARPVVQDALQSIVGRNRLTNAEMERALTLAGRGPGVTLRSTLTPGTRAGGSVLVLEGEQELVMGSYSGDNRLSPALGPWQTTLQLRLNQPFGHGEQAYAYVSTRPRIWDGLDRDAPRRVAGGGFIFPLTGNGLALNPEYTWSATRTPASLFVPLTESRFERYTLRLTYPILLNRQEEVALTGSFDATQQKNTAPDFDAVLNKDRLRVFRVGIDSNRIVGADTRLRLTGLFSKGVRKLGARTQDDADDSGIPLSRTGSSPSFSKLELGVVLDHGLPWGIQSRTSLRGQKAFGGPLPAAELFSLDGEDALSTFRSGTISDDGGWTARQELGRQFAVTTLGAPVALLPYVFAAGGKPHSESGANTGYSTSMGVGIRASWKAASLGLEYGRRKLRPGGAEDRQLFVKGQVSF